MRIRLLLVARLYADPFQPPQPQIPSPVVHTPYAKTAPFALPVSSPPSDRRIPRDYTWSAAVRSTNARTDKTGDCWHPPRAVVATRNLPLPLLFPKSQRASSLLFSCVGTREGMHRYCRVCCSAHWHCRSA
jgi:hypothetical protein